MVKLLCSSKGTGKTKQLIDMANDDVNTCNGDIVFIDGDNSHILNLNHEIRLVNAMEFNINNIERFYGFLCGIVSQDYDIEKIYIDGIYKHIDFQETELDRFLEQLNIIADRFDIRFIISMNMDHEQISDSTKEYLITCCTS